MSTLRLLSLIICFLCLSQPTFAQNTADSFSRIDPIEAGFHPDSLQKLHDFLETSGSSSLLLTYNNQVFFEWGDIYQKHTIHSIRKALLNSLYGVYVGEGIIDTSHTLASLSIQDIEPALTEQELSARIADLLKSRSGIYHPSAAETPGMAAARPERGIHAPGEAYYYNNWDFNTLGAIFEQLSGTSIYEAFLEEIAQPLHMQQYTGTYTSIDIDEEDLPIPQTDGFYQYESSKSKYPAYHFRMSAHDLALYGNLFLNKGEWEGEQILPASWVESSTQSYSITNRYMDFGYGMLWNVINANEERSSSSFYHTGVGIHMLGVYPESKLVLVHRVDTESDVDFPQDNLYTIISMVFAAQMEE